MSKQSDIDQSLSEVHESVDTTSNSKSWRKIFSFLGPAYLVSVGYMDPGNWATDLAGGSKYGDSCWRTYRNDLQNEPRRKYVACDYPITKE